MASDPEAGYECVASCRIGGVPVLKYVSKRTKMIISIAQVEGPLVNGYFCLATEAHDHDGLPHTLEHLVFMGSEKYPYKGVLDLLANRCLAQGTNAWTDVDHTCYTITTAGAEGFLNLLPIYLDHILYPTLTDAAYMTEVHHINGDGENAGVVYCEMQARENTSEDRTHFEMLQLMYSDGCGYRSETGGRMANLRDSTSNEKVKSYHSSYYRPDNLNLIITGQIEPKEVFRSLNEFEAKILSKGELPLFTQPWQSPIEPLSESHCQTVPFPTTEEDDGLVRVCWRGPKASQRYLMTAMEVIMEYLTDTPVAPLQRELVEIDDPYSSDVDVMELENSVSVFGISLEGVPYDKLNNIEEKIQSVLESISNGKELIDMTRLANILKQRILKILNQVEECPHYFFAFSLIGDFLFRPDDFGDYLDQVPRYEKLLNETESFWVDLITQYLVTPHKITVLGTPSAELAGKIEKEEKERLMKQRETLGEEGLKEKKEVLEASIKQNEVPPPDDVVSSLPVPSTDSISFHPVIVLANHNVGGASDQLVGGVSEASNRFPVQNLPFFLQFNHIHSKFVEFSAVLDTSGLSKRLRLYLSLYSELLFESPILRNGEVIPYDVVVKELQATTISHSSSLGVRSGGRFTPGQYPDALLISTKVELSKYKVGVAWLKEVLYSVQFTAERISIVSNKMINDVNRMKREGRCVIKLLLRHMTLDTDSNKNLANMVTQLKFLNQLQEQLKVPEGSSAVVADMNEIKAYLSDPTHLRIFVHGDVNSLSEEAWKELETFPRLDNASPCSLPPLPPTFSHSLSSAYGRSLIAGVGGVESNYLMQSLPCINDYNHPDLPAIMIFAEYLATLEGPMWRQIRGMGLSYHYSLSISPETGHLSFVLFKSSQLVQAYEVARDIVTRFVTGEEEFDSTGLESAKSCVIYEVIERETTVISAAREASLSHFYNIPTNYNKLFLQKISQVSIDDLKRVGQTYFSRLFDPQNTCCSICCSPGKVSEIKEGFEKFGHKIQIIDDIDSLAVDYNP